MVCECSRQSLVELALASGFPYSPYRSMQDLRKPASKVHAAWQKPGQLGLRFKGSSSTLCSNLNILLKRCVGVDLRYPSDPSGL